MLVFRGVTLEHTWKTSCDVNFHQLYTFMVGQLTPPPIETPPRNSRPYYSVFH